MKKLLLVLFFYILFLNLYAQNIETLFIDKYYAITIQRYNHTCYIFNKKYSELDEFFPYQLIDLDMIDVLHIDSLLTEENCRRIDSLFDVYVYKENLIRCIVEDCYEKKIYELVNVHKEQQKLFTEFYSKNYSKVSEHRQFIGYINECGEKVIWINFINIDTATEYEKYLTIYFFRTNRSSKNVQYRYNLTTKRLSINDPVIFKPKTKPKYETPSIYDFFNYYFREPSLKLVNLDGVYYFVP